MNLKGVWLIAALFPVLLSGCVGCTNIPPGYVGIKVNLHGSQKGVEDYPILTGRVWHSWFGEEVYKFPTFMQNVVWTKDLEEGSRKDESISFNSVEGASINTDIALSYQIEASKVPSIFVEFRSGVNEITDVYLRSKIRDAFNRTASSMRAADIFGAGKPALLTGVKTILDAELRPKGFVFDSISLTGDIRVDERVASAINAAIEASQKAIEAENKVKQTEAEARQAVARAKGEAESRLMTADAEARANKIIQSSITPTLMQYRALETWNGVLPQVTGSGGIPLINLK